MGYRFRKSMKIAPGVKFNVSKKSVGVSVGTKGARMSVNSSGRKTTSIGIPGTGITYVNSRSNNKESKNNQSYNTGNNCSEFAQKKKHGIPVYVFLLVISIILVLLGLLLTIAAPVMGIISVVFGILISCFSISNIKQIRESRKLYNTK